MPTNTTYSLSRPAWLVDYEYSPRDGGAQIDWASCDPERVDTNGNQYVLGGTIMARLASGKVIPRVDVDLDPAPGDQLGTETAVGLLIGEANTADKTDALTGYGLLLGGVVYENLLPDAEEADLDDWKTELGARFIFETHVNSIAD